MSKTAAISRPGQIASRQTCVKEHYHILRMRESLILEQGVKNSKMRELT